jgi:multimeric flavodoxin WrbA
MLLSVLNRTFYAGGSAFAHKPAATIACARRAGTTCSLDVLNKYVTISQMPLVSSSYWNGIYGRKADEVLLDEEGRQTLENLARNMAWLIKCISEGKKNGVSIPENLKVKRTNFIR